MDANNEFTQSLIKFWKENFDKVDRSHIMKEDLPETLDAWLKEIEKFKNSRYWSIVEVAWFGLGWDKMDKSEQLARWRNDDEEVPEDYFLWDYDGEQYLVDCETHDAFFARKVERVIKYEEYEPIKN